MRWSDAEGERFGVWESAQRDYRIQDRDGNIDKRLRGERAGNARMLGNALRPAPDVYMAEGVLHLAERVDSDAGEDLLTVFDGFDGLVEVRIDEGSDVKPEEAVLVPGAVAVTYTDARGNSGVLALR